MLKEFTQSPFRAKRLLGAPQGTSAWRFSLTSVSIFGFVLAVLLLLLPPHSVAQGCAMCYQNAAASGAQGRTALRHGILILMLPALSLFVGIFALIYHRRNLPR
jgi:hypothetical protein